MSGILHKKDHSGPDQIRSEREAKQEKEWWIVMQVKLCGNCNRVQYLRSSKSQKPAGFKECLDIKLELWGKK